MKFILGILVIILVIILLIVGVVLIIINKLRYMVGDSGISLMRYFFANRNQIMNEELNEPKTVSGMTKFYAPKIREDFEDFNEEILFQMIETSLRKIFDALENKRKIKDEELVMIENDLNEQIEDLNGRKESIKFDNIKFHKSAIKDYIKKDGVATITTSTSLEYYNENNEKVQTRYICKFVHIYDYSMFENNGKVFIVRCPNCGAPISNFKSKSCEYCSSNIGKILLKVWKIASYKDEYSK